MDDVVLMQSPWAIFPPLRHLADKSFPVFPDRALVPMHRHASMNMSRQVIYS